MECFYCKTTEEELRPYGPKCSMVCFDCAMLPEHLAETEQNFSMQLDTAGPIVVIGTEAGPFPFKHLKES